MGDTPHTAVPQPLPLPPAPHPFISNLKTQQSPQRQEQESKRVSASHEGVVSVITSTKLKGPRASMKSSLHWSVKSASLSRLLIMELTSCNLEDEGEGTSHQTGGASSEIPSKGERPGRSKYSGRDPPTRLLTLWQSYLHHHRRGHRPGEEEM